MPFNALGLSENLLKAVAKQGYSQPYPIQEQAIPAVLAGKDVLGIAKTGSGKTASFVLPILMKRQKDKSPKSRNVKTLVLVPTRELAVQVQEVFNQLSEGLADSTKSMAIFGGVSINPQMKNLYGMSIVIATPGRLLELVDAKSISLSIVDTLVLDEADKLLNLGFKKEVNRILSLLPKQRQSLLFSATLSDELTEINRVVLNEPLVININPQAKKEENEIDSIKQTAYAVTEERKGPLLRYLIKEQDMKQVLVFTSSAYQAKHVAEKLRKNGINTLAIYGKKSQGARTEALKQFKSGAVRVLVATDLLSRGIDIELLPHVINYELPRSPKDYIHRIGRTGRADASGEAIAFITPDAEHHFNVIQKKMKKQVELVKTDELNLNGF